VYGMNPNRDSAVAPEPAAPAQPDGFEAARTEADALDARGQFAEAAAVYEKFTRANPEFVLAHYLRIAALVRAGQAAATDAALETARRSIPTTPEKRYEAAVYLFDAVSHTKDIAAANANKLLAEATLALDDALAIKPEYMEALVYKSLVLRTRARYEPDANKVAALTAEADRLRARVMEMQKKR
jgi:tetratricopeptide (TPR) repeat protein